MTAGHTPGPWRADRMGEWHFDINYTHTDGNGNRQDGNIGVVDGKRGPLNEANARLVAAAPALLAALEALWAVALNFDARDAYNGEASWDDAVDNAHTVIMQARGEK